MLYTSQCKNETVKIRLYKMYYQRKEENHVYDNNWEFYLI